MSVNQHDQDTTMTYNNKMNKQNQKLIQTKQRDEEIR